MRMLRRRDCQSFIEIGVGHLVTFPRKTDMISYEVLYQPLSELVNDPRYRPFTLKEKSR